MVIKTFQSRSVVLVGGDGWNESKLKREFSSNWDSNNRLRLIESGKNYNNVFRGFARNDKKSSKRETDGKLNGVKLCGLINKQSIKHIIKKHLFSWVKDNTNKRLSSSDFNACQNEWGKVTSKNELKLTGFLESEWAGSYFNDHSWKQYSDAGPYFALLTLINLFSNSLANIEYEKSWPEINGENGKILKSLFEQNLKFVYLSSSKNDLESVTLHSDGGWDLTFCKEDNCKNENALRISVSRNQLCVIRDICLGNLYGSSRSHQWAQKWKNLHDAGNQTWKMLMDKGARERVLRRLLLGLVAACFNDETKVSLSINADPEKGKMLLKKLN